jgi:hypothetical protein
VTKTNKRFDLKKSSLIIAPVIICFLLLISFQFDSFEKGQQYSKLLREKDQLNQLATQQFNITKDLTFSNSYDMLKQNASLLKSLPPLPEIHTHYTDLKSIIQELNTDFNQLQLEQLTSIHKISESLDDLHEVAQLETNTQLMRDKHLDLYQQIENIKMQILNSPLPKETKNQLMIKLNQFQGELNFYKTYSVIIDETHKLSEVFEDEFKVWLNQTQAMLSDQLKRIPFEHKIKEIVSTFLALLLLVSTLFYQRKSRLIKNELIQLENQIYSLPVSKDNLDSSSTACRYLKNWSTETKEQSDFISSSLHALSFSVGYFNDQLELTDSSPLFSKHWDVQDQMNNGIHWSTLVKKINDSDEVSNIEFPKNFELQIHSITINNRPYDLYLFINDRFCDQKKFAIVLLPFSKQHSSLLEKLQSLSQENTKLANQFINSEDIIKGLTLKHSLMRSSLKELKKEVIHTVDSRMELEQRYQETLISVRELTQALLDETEPDTKVDPSQRNQEIRRRLVTLNRILEVDSAHFELERDQNEQKDERIVSAFKRVHTQFTASH